MAAQDLIGTVAVAMGASWASGSRLYAAVATLGLVQHYRLTSLPGELGRLDHPWVIGVAVLLLVCEFVADKVPWFDTGWDAVHSFIRIPAGIVLASAAFADYPGYVLVIAGLVGGAFTLTSHAGKTGTRYALNHSPEPVSNWAHSGVNDLTAVSVVGLSVFFPVLGMLLVFVLAGLAFVVLRKGRRVLKGE